MLYWRGAVRQVVTSADGHTTPLPVRCSSIHRPCMGGTCGTHGGTHGGTCGTHGGTCGTHAACSACSSTVPGRYQEHAAALPGTSSAEAHCSHGCLVAAQPQERLCSHYRCLCAPPCRCAGCHPCGRCSPPQLWLPAALRWPRLRAEGGGDAGVSAAPGSGQLCSMAPCGGHCTARMQCAGGAWWQACWCLGWQRLLLQLLSALQLLPGGRATWEVHGGHCVG